MLRTSAFAIREIDLGQALVQAVIKVAATLYHWQDRAAQRRALAELDQHALQDIGVSRREALAEARKPFWWT
ncbi:MAG: DUF1127 domain-containing protein [Alphaproteobacteria bacterium]|nr:DUF1127 domain-containing protein [Alphaproteobacteria bacterium]MBL6952375.1 DUF1127 domain-containing protein [Alphaproteobacteria bacterium]